MSSQTADASPVPGDILVPCGRKGVFLSTEYPGSRGTRLRSGSAVVISAYVPHHPRALVQSRTMHYMIMASCPDGRRVFGWIDGLDSWRVL